jgi:mono/diheme cytochrome c family protein
MKSWALALIFAVTTADAALGAEPSPDLSRGRAVFTTWCGMCHAPGATYAGTVALQVKYGGHPPAALEQRTDLSPAFVTHTVRTGVGLMPAFRKTEVSDTDLAQLALYLARAAKK